MACKIAFVSCAYATHRPVQPAWREIKAAEPDLLLMLGDNAYMNWAGLNWDFEALEACYRAQFNNPDFRAVIDRVPTLAVWDDHDCGPNDTLGAAAPADHLARTRDMFDRWMGFAWNNNRPHMYCRYDELQDVRVIVLDGRSFRTGSQGAQVTLLGAEQEQWLWHQLDPQVQAQRRFTLVACGSAFSQGADHHKVSDYRHFAAALRSRLAFRAGGPGDPGRRALFLGGDVHYNKFISHPEGFHEAVSSGVACFQPRTRDKSQFVPERHADNWGLLSIDDTQVQVQFHANPQTTGNPRPRTIDSASWKVVAP
jgi:phosphodiesterase/alkaline phosphatase D-like protein